MAVVNNYMTEEQKRINNQKARNGVSGYNYSPVSAEKKAQTPQVTQPAAQYTAGKTPGTYVSRYQPVLDSIMDQIQNPEKFKYEFNGDELFKNYADLYTQYGKQASLDAMGQAAGLTGGYGNSYGQQVGQQTYQQYLLPLNEKGLDLRNTAYQGYQDELANLKDAYSAMQAAENADYSRYADALSAWQTQQQLDEQKRMNDFDMAYKQDEFKYRWGLNQPAVAEETAAAATPYWDTRKPPTNEDDDKSGKETGNASWLTTTGNQIAAAKATQKAKEDGKKLTERYKNKK